MMFLLKYRDGRMYKTDKPLTNEMIREFDDDLFDIIDIVGMFFFTHDHEWEKIEDVKDED